MFEAFHGLTNAQVYKKSFNELFLKSDPACPGRILGNTQRADFMPYLRPLIASLPEAPCIFDVGAGSGQILDIAFTGLPRATFSLDEPNPLLLSQYKERLQQREGFEAGVVYEGPIQDFYLDDADSDSYKCPDIPPSSQDFIMAIHMIYHLSDFHESHRLSPKDDLMKALCFFYSRLKPGGCLFLVYADQEHSTSGHAARYYYSSHSDEHSMVDNLTSIWRCRNELLKAGEAAVLLKAFFPTTDPLLESYCTSSFMYGDSQEDIATMSILGELCSFNEQPFETGKLEACMRFLELYPEKIDLTVEKSDVPQKGMLRSNQPQVVTVIRKLSTRSYEIEYSGQ